MTAASETTLPIGGFRRERIKDGGNPSMSLTMVAILVPSGIGDSHYLCQGLLNLQKRSLSKITCDLSIQVLSRTESGHESSRIPEEAFSRYDMVHIQEISHGVGNSKTSNTRLADTIHDGKMDDSCSIRVLDTPFVPIVSARVTVEFDKDMPMTPIITACLKQLLFGCVVLHSDTITSTITLRHEDPWLGTITSTCRIETINSLEKPRIQPGCKVYRFLPNTMITMRLADKGGSFDSGADLMRAPPASQALVEAIRCVSSHVPAPKAFLLSGPPGVGKTHSVRVAMDICARAKLATKLLSLRGSELLSAGTGHVAESCQELLSQLERSINGPVRDGYPRVITIVFLDECEALLSVDELAATTAYVLDKISDATQDSVWANILFVAATNRVADLPSILRRSGRFDREIPLAPPNAEQRFQILWGLFHDDNNSMVPLTSITKEQMMEIAEESVGFVPADLNMVVRHAIIGASQEGTKTASLSHIRRALTEVGASALRDARLSAPPKIGWEHIAGDPGGAKTALRRAIEWPRTRKEAYEALGLVPPRGILLHGAPGTAKTTLARAAAGSAGVAFISLSPADVYASSYVGEAEAIVRRAFALARSASPSILFFDEIDSIFGPSGGSGGNSLNRSGRGSSAEARVLSTFLNEMDGVDGKQDDGVLVLAATNLPWTIDGALLRPGRLGDRIIYVPPPDSSARRALFRKHLGNWVKDESIIKKLADASLTGKMTGAEIVGACQEASMRMLRDFLSQNENGQDTLLFRSDYVEDALRKVRPVLSDTSLVERFHHFQASRS